MAKSKTLVILTPSAEHLKNSLESKTDVATFLPNKDGKLEFPDGESYIRLPEVDDYERIMLVHSGLPDTDKGLFQLDYAFYYLVTKGKMVDIFFTKFPYDRQDQEFQKGEINIARKLLEKYSDHYTGPRNVYLLEPHFGGRSWLEDLQRNPSRDIKLVSAVPLLKREFEKNYSDFVYVAPDKGAARRFGIDLHLEKERINSNKVELSIPENVKRSINGKYVALLDDIIATGGTSKNAADALKNAGAKDVALLATHITIETGLWVCHDYQMYFTNSTNLWARLQNSKQDSAGSYKCDKWTQAKRHEVDISELILEQCLNK